MGDATSLLKYFRGPYQQLGIVVNDLSHHLSRHLSQGPWTVYEYDPMHLRELMWNDHPAKFRFLVAINQSTPQLEFIQPVGSPNPYGQWLEQHGPSMHHLGFFVEDAVAATELARSLGLKVLMSGAGQGADGSGAYSYIDTQDELGYLIEIIQRPQQRRAPYAVVRGPADLPLPTITVHERLG